MMKRLMLGASVVALSLVAAPTAHAQVGVGVSAGISIPTGDLGNAVKSGYSVNGLIGFAMPMSPIGFRGEVGYNSWDAKSGSTGTISSLSGTANVVLQVPGMIVAKPYLIAGLGEHHMKYDTGSSVFGSATENKLGWNVGGGLNFGLGTLSTMVEARYVTVNTSGSSIHYVPVTFGIMF